MGYLNMGIDKKQLVQYVIEPTLQQLNLYSRQAALLLLGTAEIESQCGIFIHQIRGPALGIYQMEPATHDDIWENFIKNKNSLKSKPLISQCIQDQNRLVYDLQYATMMTRLHYLRVSESLPLTPEGMARYHKQFYNTPAGKTDVNKSIEIFTHLAAYV